MDGPNPNPALRYSGRAYVSLKVFFRGCIWTPRLIHRSLSSLESVPPNPLMVFYGLFTRFIGLADVPETD